VRPVDPHRKTSKKIKALDSEDNSKVKKASSRRRKKKPQEKTKGSPHKSKKNE